MPNPPGLSGEPPLAGASTAPTDSPTTPYVAKLPAPLVVTAVIDAATAGYPSGTATAFRGS